MEAWVGPVAIAVATVGAVRGGVVKLTWAESGEVVPSAKLATTETV